MTDQQILIIGASGRIGTQLQAELVARGLRPRGATRHPERHRPQQASMPTPGGTGEDGTTWVRFDLTDPTTYAPALAGVDRVFLAARPGDEHSDAVAGPFISAMRHSGVRKVINLTAMGTDQRPDFALRRLELLLEASGLAWTHLRPNWFFQVFTEGSLLAGLRGAGTIRLPAADARLSFIDARDVAAVAAVLLADGGHEGEGLTLTGPAAHDHHEVAEAIGEATGRTMTYEPVEEDEARASLAAAGFPPAWQERLVRFYQLVRAGYCSPVSEAVQRVTGRAPIGLARFARDHAHAWRA
ncbi:MAG: NAD(P)H-binding protein [Candidatus Riflebacteria bacterium]|nr:NAD(P)H-binding protein [Candidatus Riflebacteria bacterium]